jgi:hypothetical protein
VFALWCTGCAKIVVTKIPKDQTAAADGVIYALPNTVVRAQLKVDRSKIAIVPKYSEFVKIFVPGGKSVCKATCTDAEKNSSEYSVQQGATFSTYGEPDPDNVYIAKFTGGGAIDQTLSMTWTETGLLSAASASVTNRSIDIVTSGLKAAAGIGLKSAGLGAATALAAPNDCDGKTQDADKLVIPILTGAGAPAQALITNYCALDPAERKQIATDSTLLKAAVIDFAPLARLDATRDNVLNGAQIIDPSAAVTLLDTEISKLQTQFFLGSKATTTWDGALDVRSVVAGTVSILSLNPSKGICITGASIPPDGKQLPDGFLASGADCMSATPVNLQINYYPARSNQLFSKITDVDKGDRSFRYRIPAQVNAQLLDDKKTYGSGVFSVAQLGTVVSLPATRKSKTLSYDLAFVESTGALKTFKLGTTGGLDASTIDALTGVGTSLLDAKNKAAQNSSQAAVLTQQDQLLKLQDDICTIQKKYGLACTVQP